MIESKDQSQSDQPSANELRGWESIVELTDGFDPNSIDALKQARQLESVYPLLHALVGRSLRDFFVRTAALEAIVKDGRPAFSAKDLKEVLYWLSDSPRELLVKALRSNGWLEYDPAIGTTVSDSGRWTYEVLAFLHKRLHENEIKPTVSGIEYALQIGVDPLRHLESLRSRLNALYHDIEVARASYSEVVLRKAAAKLDEALRLSEHIRHVLDRVPQDHRSARQTSRQIHELLSKLHGASADLHAAVTEVGRQYLRLTSGMTVEQIVRGLMRRSKHELAVVGKQALLPVFSPPPLLNSEVVASTAEQQVLREHPEAKPIVWEEPIDVAQVSQAEMIPEEVSVFVTDMCSIAKAGENVTLNSAIPRRSAGETFLRASLLPLVGIAGSGEGVTGQLGAMLMSVEMQNDGWPEPDPENLKDAGIVAFTPGMLITKVTKRKSPEVANG